MLATLAIVIFAFTGQYHSKRLLKKASKLDTLKGGSDSVTLTGLFPAQPRESILHTHPNPLHGDNHSSHPLGEQDGGAVRERQVSVPTGRASIL